MRKIISIVTLIIVLISPTVYAIELGQLKLLSKPTKPLAAEIELLQIQHPKELSKIKITLANHALFKKHQVDRLYVLKKLKFKSYYKGKNKYVVRVTTDRMIKEKFLNFVITVNWSNGLIHRVFTISQDLPVLGEKSNPMINAVQAKPRKTRKNKKLTYKTKKGDSLWRISKYYRDHRQVKSSLKQVMVSVYMENINAFKNGNINNLKSGVILRAPTVEEINLLAKPQAQKVYGELTNWARFKKQIAKKISEQPVITKKQMKSKDVIINKPVLKIAVIKTEKKNNTKSSKQSESKKNVKEKNIFKAKKEFKILREQFYVQKLNNKEVSKSNQQLSNILSKQKRLLNMKDNAMVLMQLKINEQLKEKEKALKIYEATLLIEGLKIIRYENEMLKLKNEQMTAKVIRLFTKANMHYTEANGRKLIAKKKNTVIKRNIRYEINRLTEKQTLLEEGLLISKTDRLLRKKSRLENKLARLTLELKNRNRKNFEMSNQNNKTPLIAKKTSVKKVKIVKVKKDVNLNAEPLVAKTNINESLELFASINQEEGEILTETNPMYLAENTEPEVEESMVSPLLIQFLIGMLILFLFAYFLTKPVSFKN